MKSSNIKMVAGALVGATAGVFAGLLVAPYSGKAARRKIGLRMLKEKQDLQNKTHEAMEKIKDASDYAVLNLKKEGDALETQQQDTGLDSIISLFTLAIAPLRCIFFTFLYGKLPGFSWLICDF